MRARLKDWRTVLTGDDVADTRQGIRELLTTAIKFTPFVDARGFRAIRFEGRWGLEAVFGGEVTSMASFSTASWNTVLSWLLRVNDVRALLQNGL
jgi:hypothetical protein